VYLPKGTWIDFWTDEIVQGGTTIDVATPLERMPLFVKHGSIIPMAPVMNYSDERPLDTLTIHVYPLNAGEVQYTLYEDDGRSREYQTGSYSMTTFTQRTAEENGVPTLFLTTGESRGASTGKLKERDYVFEVHGISEKPIHVQCNGSVVGETNTMHPATSDGKGFAYDVRAKRLSVRVHGQLNTSTTIEITLARRKQ